MRQLTFATAALACLGLLAPRSTRADTHTIKVSDGTPPAGNLPISRVKALLVGAYQANVSLTVNDSEALAFPGGGPDVQATSITNPENGRADQIIVRRLANDLLIQIEVSSLLDPVNACTQANPAANASHTHSYAITLGGNAPVTGSALVGYSAASTANCGCKFRRRPTGVAWDTAPPAVVPPGPSMRIPVSLMFLLDESGSMLSPPAGPGAGNATKWTLTREATSQFIDTLEVGEPNVADRLGVTFFDHAVNLFVGGAPPPWFPKAGGGFLPLKTELDAATHPHAGSTSIGGGLKTALEHTLCDSPDPLADPVILLMSDGMQNTAPLVADAAGVKQLAYSTSCPTGAAVNQALSQVCIPVLSVYVDQLGASPGPALLQAISLQTAGGNASSAELITGPPAAFSNILLTMLKGGTMSLLAKSVATMPAGQSAAAPVSANVDGTVKRLVLLLGWLPEHGNENALTVRATPPGGVTPDRGAPGAGAPSRAHSSALFSDLGSLAAPAAAARGRETATGVVRGSPFHIVAAGDLPASGVGDWAFEVHRIGDGTQRAIPYQLFVYAVESKLQFISRFTPVRHGTGQPLVLNLDLSLDRQPFTGSHDAIKISVDGPTGAIGTLLHDLKDPGGPATPGEAANQSPADKKIENLSRDPAVLAQTLPKSTGQALSFHSVGEGVYQVKLSEPRVPGTYVFHLTLDIGGPAGPIHRVEDVETQVEVLPDATQIVVTKLSPAVFAVHVIPRDRFGNYLGPGFADQIQLRIPPGGGKLAATTDVEVTGAYTLQVADVPPGTDPDVELVVSGSVVARGPLSTLKPLPQDPKGPQGGGCCGSTAASAAANGRHAAWPFAALALAGVRICVRRRRR